MTHILQHNGYNGKKKNIYFTDTKEKYDKYLNEYASLFRGKAFEKWGNK